MRTTLAVAAAVMNCHRLGRSRRIRVGLTSLWERLVSWKSIRGATSGTVNAYRSGAPSPVDGGSGTAVTAVSAVTVSSSGSGSDGRLSLCTADSPSLSTPLHRYPLHVSDMGGRNPYKSNKSCLRSYPRPDRLEPAGWAATRIVYF